jgi:hypothetical protein
LVNEDRCMRVHEGVRVDDACCSGCSTTALLQHMQAQGSAEKGRLVMLLPSVEIAKAASTSRLLFGRLLRLNFVIHIFHDFIPL